MCFAPAVSLTIAIIEFIVAILLITYFRRTTLTKFSSIFIALLGFYQLTQYFLCTSQNPQLWAIIGFITYTFLPPLGLHFTLAYTHKKNDYLIIYYLPASILSLIAISYPNFVSQAYCSTVLVVVQSLFFNIQAHPVLTVLYMAYYLAYVIIPCLIIIPHIHQEHSGKRKVAETVVSIALITSLGAAFILITLLPDLRIMFPSIYCSFAVLFSIAAFIAAWYEQKGGKKHK
ncbi:hypothetical protein HYV86_04820 [Candidatus Woesearchaeota archaeon]|nr:hypothetical protein [Candidatus Woesearchaeota archaeon]